MLSIKIYLEVELTLAIFREIKNCTQHILGHKQCINKRWKTMLGEQQQGIPYTYFDLTVRLSHLRA